MTSLTNLHSSSLDFGLDKMRYLILLVCVIGGAIAQFQGGSPPWGQGPGPNRPPIGGKPNRPTPFGSSSSTNSKQSYSSASYNDDPIPANSRLDSTYDTQQLPAKLPILAPNGVVEIYNRVVDDLLKRLEGDFKKREIDPMDVVIRPTPAGPVRVPGHLQKRPFRRPGAALYRNSAPIPLVPLLPPGKPSSAAKLPIKRKSRSNDLPPLVRFPDERPVASSGEEGSGAAPAEGVAPEVGSKASFRGAGKISKDPLNEDDEKESLLPETTTVFSTTAVAENKTEVKTTEAPEVDDTSEEDEPFFSRARSEEYLNNEDEDVDLDLDAIHEVKEEKSDKKGTPVKKVTKKEGTDEELEDEEDAKDKLEGSKDVETLLQKYQTKNTNAEKVTVAGTKTKYAGNPKKKDTASELKKTKTKLNSKEAAAIKDEEEDDEDDFDNSKSDEDDDDDVHHPHHHEMYNDDLEPGTGQSGGNRPNGGYYQNGGPPAVPAKPNAQLTGLSRIRRASDVSVSVDARSAVITARLLVGPLNVVINDSVEPLERNVRATIPELEAELLLMERHGVVFLQRFTLDRAYGQDVEISIPKVKGDSNKKKKGGLKGGHQSIGGPPLDPMHSGAQQRYQTKMAAHVSMEIVKLLRSGNLRVNLMRTAQSSMSKLKLPIQKVKKSKKKSKKSKSDKNSKSAVVSED